MKEDTEDSGIEWLVQFHLSEDEVDDSFDDSPIEDVVIVASDFDTAVKYAKQYIRVMESNPETESRWKDAEILSIDRN